MKKTLIVIAIIVAALIVINVINKNKATAPAANTPQPQVAKTPANTGVGVSAQDLNNLKAKINSIQVENLTNPQ